MSKTSASAVARSNGTERVLTGLLAVLAILGGVAVLVVGYGFLGDYRADRPLLDPIALGWMRDHLLATRISAVVLGAVLLLVGLVWFIQAIRTERHPDMRLDDVVVTRGALTDAIRRDAETVCGVSRVRASLVGRPTNPALRLTLWLREGTDIREVWQQLDEQVLSRARQTLEVEELPAAIRLELDARARQRVT